jgi:peroxiredoxin/outer membrane lipoprotein-sorting protein
MTRALLPLLSALVLLVAPASLGQSTPPTPSTHDDAAVKLLESVGQAYSAVKSLELSGTISFDVDAAGNPQNQSADFTTTFSAPMRFRHEVKDQLLVVSNAEKTLIYSPEAKQYAESPALSERCAVDKLPEPLPMLLREQNPALLLAMCSDAASALVPADASLTSSEDVVLNEKPYRSLSFKRDGQIVRLLIDPATKLLRQVRIDATESLLAAGVPDVKRAELRIDYVSTKVDHDLPVDAFAWAPPKDARLVGRDNPMELVELEADPMDGKPAPDFTLERLEGGEVKLANLKGKVVVLDFWATWCPPCREGLPHLAKLYAEKKADGLQLFAVNVRETKPQVQQFLEKAKLSLPVLMDTKGEVAGKYAVRGIPKTIVIGKDGKISAVFVGFGPGSGEKIDQAVAAAMKQ